MEKGNVDNMKIEANAKKYIEDCMRKFEYKVSVKKNLEETILEIFIGTCSTTRLGPRPIENTRNNILKRIKYKINKGEPLEVSSAWGAIKTVSTQKKGVDIAEMFMFSQYESIYRRIKKVYPPGVIFNIYLGDSYYEYLYGYDNNIKEYCNGMVKLARKYEGITPHYMSKIVAKIDDSDLICQHNYELLRDFWNETTGMKEMDFCKTETYKRLDEAGWVGIIPVTMRDFYLKRMKNNYKDKDENFWIEKVLKFFSYGMFISQYDLMGRNNPDTSTVDSCLLRIPPPGLPKNLYSNRIRMRIAPENIIRNSAPPWTVSGAVSIRKNGDLKMRIVDSSISNIIKMEYSEYNGITYGIIDEEIYPNIY